MTPHPVLQMLLGSHVVFIGRMLLLIHRNRNRNNLGGRFFQLGREMNRGRLPERTQAVAFVVLGWMNILTGLIVLLAGFRPTMVG